MVYYSDSGSITYLDYAEALAVARLLYKPLLLQFIAIDCLKCKRMEEVVFNDPKIVQMLKKDFIVTSLYVDVQNIYISEGEQQLPTGLNEETESSGNKSGDILFAKFGGNALPFYLFVDENENRLVEKGVGYDPDIKKFTDQLEKAKKSYKKIK